MAEPEKRGAQARTLQAYCPFSPGLHLPISREPPFLRVKPSFDGQGFPNDIGLFKPVNEFIRTIEAHLPHEDAGIHRALFFIRGKILD